MIEAETSEESGPPTLAKTSWITPGFSADPLYVPSPHFKRDSEFFDPAWRRSPETLTPSTFDTSMHGSPFEEINVARPIPRITVFGLVTFIDP
jgi:hypothetical protein